MTAKPEQYRIIKRPIQTEKSVNAHTETNTLAFEVALDANKTQIEQAVRDIFDVKIKSVRTMRIKGRKRRRNRYGYYNESDWKKALVTLHEGEIIEIK